MAACVNGVFHRVDTLEGSFISKPTAESFICSGAGNDRVTILRSNYTCNGLTIGPFDYGGYQLHIYGQAGRDTLLGGDGTDVICGGSGSDTIYGYGGVDFLDGWTGCDKLNGGYHKDHLYGYLDADYLIENNTGSTLYGEGGHYDCLDSNSNPAVIDCGPGYDAVSNPGSGEVNCEYERHCAFTWSAGSYCSDA